MLTMQPFFVIWFTYTSNISLLFMQVVDTAQQVGRYSVSTAPDLPYKEMASHCEALLMGKQQKMSNLMTAQRQDYLISLCVEKDELEQKRPAPQSLVKIRYFDFKLFRNFPQKSFLRN